MLFLRCTVMITQTVHPVLLLKQIELKYLSKIKKLLYHLAVVGPVAPNISQLATNIQTSRATVMNYIKYLADARLINMVYAKGDEFPKKPARVMMHNTSLMYSIYPVKVEELHVLETFFLNNLWKDHKLNKGEKGASFLVDEHLQFYAQVGAGGDLFAAHLAGQHHAGETGITEKLDTLRRVAGQLGGGVERHLGHHRLETAGKAHVLHNQSVHTAFGGLDRHLHGAVDLVLPQQGVEGQVHRHRTGVTIRHRLAQRVDGEIVGVAAGVKLLHT